MSVANDSLENCTQPVDTHRFDNISVKCVFKCKNPGYKTYSGLHKHYLDVHKICLHRVAQLDPENEDEFRKQVASFLAPFTPENVRSQGSHRGRIESHASKLPATSPIPQVAGPSCLGSHWTLGHMAFNPALADPGRDNLQNPPSRYPTPILIRSPNKNHTAGMRPPVLDEVGPSRSPAVYPTARHQPYPQSRPQQHGLRTSPTPVHGKAKGKACAIPSTVMIHGILTPSPLSPGTRLEHATPINQSHDETPAESPVRYPQSPQAMFRIPTPVRSTQVPQHPIDEVAPENFHLSTITQENSFHISSTQESEGLMPACHTWNTRPQRPQPQAIVTGFRDPPSYLPTPPMGTNSLPNRSPHFTPLDQRRRSPRRVHRECRPCSRPVLSDTSGTSRLPTSHSAARLISHPYPRPENGSATSELTRWVCEGRQQGLPMETNTANEAPMPPAPPIWEAQTQGTADVQDYTANATPGPSEVQETETTLSLADQRSHPVTSPTGPTSPHIRPTSRRVLPRPEDLMPIIPPAVPRASAALPQDQAQTHRFRQANSIQGANERSVMREGQPQAHGPARAQIPCEHPVPRPAGQPRISEAIARFPTAQGLNQGPSPTQPHDSDNYHPSKADSTEGGAPREEGDTQDLFSHISWEGWGLVKTPNGVYLPETFSSSLPTTDDPTNWW